MPNNRIALLDSFRFIAIVFVLVFHLTNPLVEKYPHHYFFLHVFKYGYLGVYFFFMISGFVICQSLEHTQSIGAFFRKRFARLFPAMLLCTTLTFLIIRWLGGDDEFANSRDLKNFLPSLTFINPQLWRSLTGVNFRWINGSYWSLWVEVQFYTIVAILYFLNKRHFRRNLFIIGIGITVSKYIPIQLLNHYQQQLPAGAASFLNSWRFYNEVFNITFFITWFLCGAAFHFFYTGLKNRALLVNLAWLFLISICLVKDAHDFFSDICWEMVIAFLTISALFMLLIYRGKWLAFLEIPLLCRIGVISYSIYLIHEQIGILLINNYQKYLGERNGLSPFIVIIIVICYGELSYRFYEKPVSKMLTR